jgi:HEAT repeat protein
MRDLCRCCVIVVLVLSFLSSSPPALAQLLPLTGATDSNLVRRINSEFKELATSPVGKGGRLVPALLDSLSGLEHNMMYQVYQQLHVIMGDPSVVEALVQALKTNRAETASLILANCRNYRTSFDFSAGQTKEIISAVRTENSTVRQNLAQVLGSISLPGDSSVQETLIGLLQNDPQSQVRSVAAGSLANIGREVYFKKAAPIARAFADALTRDSSPEVRSAAASGLSQMGAKAEPAAAALLTALTDNSAQVRSQVLQSITNIGPACSGCVDELIDMFNGPSDLYRSSRTQVAQALGAIGPAAARAVPLLIPMLRDRSSASVACHALEGIGPDAVSAVPDLCKLLESPFVNDRAAAAKALGAMGAKAKSALPALRKASTDERNGDQPGNAFYNKQVVQEAIYKIEGETGPQAI